MKISSLLIIGFMLSFTNSIGQVVSQLSDRTLYRGTDYTFTLVLDKADSLAPVTVLLYRGQNDGAFTTNLQPAINRTGRNVAISWSETKTFLLPVGRYWLTVRVSGSVKFTAWVVVTNTPTNTQPPGSVTVVSPVTGAGGVFSDNVKVTHVSNISPSGFRITHGKGTKLVSVTFFRDDTGQADPLWRGVIIDENTVEAVGPPGETFTGYEVIKPYSITNQ